MKKIFRLAFLGSVVAGGVATVTFRGWTNQPLQLLYLPQKQELLAGETNVATQESLFKNETIISIDDSLFKSNYILSKDRIKLEQYLSFNLPLQIKATILNDGIANNRKEEFINTEEAIFRRVMQYAAKEKLPDRSMNEIMQAIAIQFLGSQYKANLLDRQEEETVVVSLDKFDCVLFVETVLAIARGITLQDYSYNTFVDRIRDQRYRDGQLNGYCSRLHYFSDWIKDNEKRGTVRNISLDIGGVTLNKNLNFMSRHRNSYPRMVSNDSNYQCIVQTEANLNGVAVNYIPKNRIRQVYSQLRSGDIVAVATSINGLDVTHTGLVYRHSNGNLGFIHASPAGVVTTARDLQRYVRNVKNAIGIVVARPIDPRTLKGNGF